MMIEDRLKQIELDAAEKAIKLYSMMIQSGFAGQMAAYKEAVHAAQSMLVAAGAWDVAEDLEPLRIALDECERLEKNADAHGETDD